MLYVNRKELDKTQPQWKRYEEFLTTKLPNMPDTVVFKSGQPIRFNDTGLPEPAKSETIPYVAITSGDFGTETWQYTNRPPEMRDNRLVFTDRRYIFRRAWKIDKRKHPDLIFFLLELSPLVQKGILIYEDRKAEARRKIMKEMGTTDVKFMIYSDHSPLSVVTTGNESALRVIAASWGVPNAHDKEVSIEEIQLGLFGRVESSEKNKSVTGRGYREFLNEVQIDENMALRANIQRAIDDGIIKYDQRNSVWKYTGADKAITVVSGNRQGNPSGALFEYLQGRVEAREALVSSLAIKYTPEVQEETIEETRMSPSVPNVTAPDEKKLLHLQGLNYREKQKIAKENGINAFGMKTDELDKKLLEVLSS